MLSLLLVSSLFAFLGVKSAWGEPQTIRVPDDYAIIQSAINVAKSGDTVFVSSGTYNETLVVNKTISLVGENASTTIIDGRGLGHVVNVTAQGVNLSGFTIRNGRPFSGIYLNVLSNTTTISGNIITNNDEGIQFQNSSNNIVTGNILSNNIDFGVYMAHSRKNLISKNIIASTFAGIRLVESSSQNIINGNTVTNNTYSGISLSSSDANDIKGNVISNNLEGIFLSNTNSCKIIENTIANNTVNNVFLHSSNENVFYRNNFMNNKTSQVSLIDSVNVMWDNGAEGNYWSDHQTQDENGDGINDLSYSIDANNVDNYPLTEPWSSIRTFEVVHDAETFQVTLLSNFTVGGFNFSSSLRQVSFSATGPSGAVGLCNATIPKQLLSGLTWLVLVDGENVTESALIVENSTYTTLFFTFSFSTRRIKIINADVTVPRADAGPDQIVNEDTLVTLNGSASWDDFGVESYLWTFIDENMQSLSGEIVFYNFTTPGVYIVTLNVSDAGGNWAIDSVIITVLDVTPPVANAGQDQTVDVGAAVTFDASDSGDNVGIVGYFWDFGDNSTLNMTTPIATHIYLETGNYTVTLTVRDAANNFAADTVTVTVVVSEEAFPPWNIIVLTAVVAVALIITAFFLRYRKRRM